MVLSYIKTFRNFTHTSKLCRQHITCERFSYNIQTQQKHMVASKVLSYTKDLIKSECILMSDHNKIHHRSQLNRILYQKYISGILDHIFKVCDIKQYISTYDIKQEYILAHVSQDNNKPECSRTSVITIITKPENNRIDILVTFRHMSMFKNQTHISKHIQNI